LPDAALPGPQCCHSLMPLPDGTLLLTGGVAAYAGAGLTGSLIYDPGTSLFSPTGALAVGRAQVPAVGLPDGRILIPGGDADPDHRTAEIYIPADRHYIGAGAMRVMRDRHTATLLGDGTVLIAGGSYDDASLELFGPALPPPTSLQIQPGSATIPTGGAQPFTRSTTLAERDSMPHGASATRAWLPCATRQAFPPSRGSIPGR
jgi:hypothetical protein